MNRKLVGILGHGQLARMMAIAVEPWDIRCASFDVREDCWRHPVDNQMITDIDPWEEADVITAEFEHIPANILKEAEDTGRFLPGSNAINIGADRIAEREALDVLNIATADHEVVENEIDLAQVPGALGYPFVIKSAGQGYDGKGQWQIHNENDWNDAQNDLLDWLSSQGYLLAEKFVNFSREISIIGVRNQAGETRVYPITENIHHEGILHVSIAPAKNAENLQEQAEAWVTSLMDSLDYVGVLAMELFDTDDGLLVNEIAPRVHNSGHWTIGGAETNQFANHMRAVLGMPLGSTVAKGVSAMINIIGTNVDISAVMNVPGCHYHWYSKAVRPGRKVGHINITAADEATLKQRLSDLTKVLPEEHFPALHKTYL